MQEANFPCSTRRTSVYHFLFMRTVHAPFGVLHRVWDVCALLLSQRAAMVHGGGSGVKVLRSEVDSTKSLFEPLVRATQRRPTASLDRSWANSYVFDNFSTLL